MKKQKFSLEEERLLCLFRTEPKIIKSRQLVRNPESTSRDESPFKMKSRLGYVVNFPIVPNEFYLVSHEKAWEEGEVLKPPSGVYWDFRNMSEGMLSLMGKVLSKVPLDIQPQCCAGIPTTGGKLAQYLSAFSNIKYLDIFQKVNTPEGDSTIEPLPDIPPGNGELLLLVDDVLSKGTSATPIFNAAERLGYNPVGLLVAVDRQQGGVARLQKAGRRVWWWKTAEEILEYLRQAPEEIRITESQFHSAIESLRQDQFVE